MYINKLGLGAYKTNGVRLATGNTVPTVMNSKSGVIIKHKEYIGDITASELFKLQIAQAINPSNYFLFPWLSTVAQRFEEYKFKGLVFEFKTMSSSSILSATSTALGTVMMGTEYDILDGNFDSKLQMNNHEFSSSTKPSMNMLHFIETKGNENVLKKRFCRDYTSLPDPDVADDPRFYDLGIFQVATQGMQAAVINSTIGEIWASYTCQFYKPQLPNGIDTTFQQRVFWQQGSAWTWTPTTPFLQLYSGAGSAVGRGNKFSGKFPLISFGSVGNTISFDNSTPDGVYFVAFRFNGNEPASGLSTRLDHLGKMPGAMSFTPNSAACSLLPQPIFDGSTTISTVSNMHAPRAVVTIPANNLLISGSYSWSCLFYVKLVRSLHTTNITQPPGLTCNIPITCGAVGGLPATTPISLGAGILDFVILPIDSSLTDYTTFPPA